MRCALLWLHIRLVIWAIPLMDRRLGFPDLACRLLSVGGWIPYRQVPSSYIALMVRTALLRPRMMRRRSCYRLGLATGHFLRLAGHQVELHFAVAPPEIDPARLHGHCWVTLDGEAITDPPPVASGMRTLLRIVVDNNGIPGVMYAR